MTLLEFKNRVKREARLEGGTDLDILIVDLYTEAAREYARKSQYSDLLVVDESLALTAAATSVALPDDFVHLVDDSIRFNQDTNTSWLLYSRSTRLIRTDGVPYFFVRAGFTLYLYPHSDIVNTNTITLSYYRQPALLTADDDEIDIPALYDTIVNAVLAKLSLFHGKPEVYGGYKQEEGSNFKATRAAE